MHFAAAIAADWLNSRKLAGAVDPSIELGLPGLLNYSLAYWILFRYDDKFFGPKEIVVYWKRNWDWHIG